LANATYGSFALNGERHVLDAYSEMPIQDLST
jgi:hypothetical protein